MRTELLEVLRCPRCRAERSFELDAGEQTPREVRAGALTCARCGERRTIAGGIVDLLVDPPDFVVREQAGLDRFADFMRADGWDREKVLKLPEHDSGYWFAQGTLMNQVLDTVALRPGDWILDVGSNTCWASAIFAQHGLRPIALDINANEMQGLATADWWYEDRGAHMERVLGAMFDLPLASDSLDWIWCCEVLHHNHRANLFRTMRELYRVLKPGAALIVVNETLRNLRDPQLNPGKDVAVFEGHEHAYMRFSYTRAARAAGFDVDVRGPRLHRIFYADGDLTLKPTTTTRQAFRAALAHAVRRSPRAQAAYLAYKAYIDGQTSLHMIATKPGARAVGAGAGSTPERVAAR